MTKIAFLDGYTIDLYDMDWASFYGLGDLHFYEYTSDTEYASRVKDADILIVNKFRITPQVLESAPNLKLIVVAATGYNNLDLPAISQRGIVACNVRGYSSSGVAQHVWSLLLNHYSRIQHYIDEVKYGRWNKTRDFCFYDHSIEEVAGKVLGIIGFGNIGKAVAKIAYGFDMKVITHSAYDIPQEYSYVEKVSIDQLYEQSNIISLHCPLTDQTKGLINKQSLAKMKPDSILINTSRGPLIHEEDLNQHLIGTPSFTALIDVLSVEPPQNGNVLLGLDNCNITPHIAWAYKQSRQRLIDGLAQNIKAYQEGSPINLVV